MNQEKYISLIIKQFSEKLSSEEEKVLSEWESSDITNRKLKDKLKASWDKAKHYKEDVNVNEKDAWSNISSKLHVETKRTTNPNIPKTIPIWRRPLSIAASLLVLAACSWFLLSDANGQKISYSTNTNETLDITLPDGSLIYLNENSQIAYLEEEGQRNVNLNGEAFFDVSHDAANPFVVKSNNTTTTVLGTKFNINAKSNELTEVSLYEGKVSFDGADQKSTILLPGNMIRHSSNQNKTELLPFKNENAIAWKTKELKFENDKIEEVIKTIEAYFDREIELKLNGNDCVFTSNFKDPKYNDVIEVLKFTYDLSIESRNSSDIINIKDCK